MCGWWRKLVSTSTNIIQLRTKADQKDPRLKIDKNVPWKAPENGWLKVNFDASFFNETKTGGIGVAVRDTDGFVMAAAAIKIAFVPDATTAEAMAAVVATRFARDCCFTDIALEGDALSIIKAIQAVEKDLTRYGSLIDECKMEGSKFSRFKAGFTKRSGNQLAHQLARLAISLPENMYWMEEYPMQVHNIVMLDAINI